MEFSYTISILGTILLLQLVMFNINKITNCDASSQKQAIVFSLFHGKLEVHNSTTKLLIIHCLVGRSLTTCVHR